jgi:hypothetical protein
MWFEPCGYFEVSCHLPNHPIRRKHLWQTWQAQAQALWLDVEGKNNASGIRWCDDHVEWSGLSLSFLFDHKDKFGVQAHALSHEVKYVRLVKKTMTATPAGLPNSY